MKVGDKVQFTDTAPRRLIYLHGSASVLTVIGMAASLVFVRQDWTQSEEICDASDLQVLESDDAEIQALIYQAHLDAIRKRNAPILEGDNDA